MSDEWYGLIEDGSAPVWAGAVQDIYGSYMYKQKGYKSSTYTYGYNVILKLSYSI